MSTFTDLSVFNRRDRFIEGWYFALKSSELRVRQTKALNFLGKQLVVYRGVDGAARAMDAYCPHMGAHLAEGKVDGNSIRCMFHNWKFSERGECTEIPCLNRIPQMDAIAVWPVAERYEMIWIWTGSTPTTVLPFVPELEGQDVDVILGNRFSKACHPNVVMINAIDAQHFYSVHPLTRKIAGKLQLEPYRRDDSVIEFRNQTQVPKNFLIGRLLSHFYSGPLTYWMSYWFASTGTVTIGPDFLHFHIMFALRPKADGSTEGQTILITKKRKGLFGNLFNKCLLIFTRVVGNYFATGDTKIFRTIDFNLRTPIIDDNAIMRFMSHAEQQRVANWGFSSNLTQYTNNSFQTSSRKLDRSTNMRQDVEHAQP